MDEQNISLRKAFDEVFGKEDKYFGEWFVKSDESFTAFLDKLSYKEIFFKQLRYLFLYFESLEILKRQAVDKNWSIANVLSKDIWYCFVLLLLIGLIDQHTKQEKNSDNKIKTQKERFQIVMNSLLDHEKKHMMNHYHGNRYKKFDDVVSHLYSTRNFFAHEIILPDGAIPQDGFLGFSNKEKDKIIIFPNMPHGRIILTIIIALVRYFGFSGKMEISSTKKFDSISDMLRRS